MYKEKQEKMMATMETTMQLILEKLDKKERKGIYEENEELVEEARTQKEIVQQVKEVGTNRPRNNPKQQRKVTN